MATIGQSLTAPESGWKRIDDTDASFKYNGDWNTSVVAGLYNGSRKYSGKVGDTITFSFSGTKLRIIGALVTTSNTNGGKTIKINIDGESYVFSNINSSTSVSNNVDQALLFEKNGLDFSKHVVVIELASNYFWFDAIDIDENGEIFRPPNKKLLIRNDNTYYSLAENTIIHLPDNSSESMIKYGIEQGKEIQLDIPFDKHRYFNDTPVDGTSGKVFTHDIGKVNSLSIKEIRESKSIVTTWYNTNMTANNAPAPYVASASSEYQDTSGRFYSAFCAFDGKPENNEFNLWATVTGQAINSWINIDYGEAKKVNTLSITPRFSPTANPHPQTPKDFIVEGSKENKTWSSLGTFSVTNWIPSTASILPLNNSDNRYYRITILSLLDSKFNNASIAEIKYGFREVK